MRRLLLLTALCLVLSGGVAVAAPAAAQDGTPTPVETSAASPTPGAALPVSGAGGGNAYVDTAALLTIVFIAVAGLGGAAIAVWRGIGR